MWINEVGPEELAEIIDRYNQALTSELPRQNVGSHSDLEETTLKGKSPLVANVRSTPSQSHALNRERPRSRPYFATAGEAEWGC